MHIYKYPLLHAHVCFLLGIMTGATQFIYSVCAYSYTVRVHVENKYCCCQFLNHFLLTLRCCNSVSEHGRKPKIDFSTSYLSD